MAPTLHQFHAIAFEENLSLRQLSPGFEVARDRRLLVLELAVVFLILLELIVSLPRLW